MSFREILDQVLGYALSENQNQEALVQLKQWEQENPTLFVTELAGYLADQSKEKYRRQMSGVTLKNFLHSENDEKRSDFTLRWLNEIPETAKLTIREAVYHCLNDDELLIRKVSAQVLGKISVIDFPDYWPNLMSMLLQNVVSGSNMNLKASSLYSIGFICEDVVDMFPEKMAPITDVVLTAFVHSLTNDNPDFVQVAACETLANALDFCKSNFDKDGERRMIMDVLMQSTRSQFKEVSIYSFFLLGCIAGLYYEYMSEFIQSLFELTIEAINHADEEIAKQAVEFWSTLAEEERSRVLSGNGIFNFLLGAKDFLTPVLFMALTKHESEDYDIDELTLPMISSICINSIARLLGKEIIPILMPLINQHIGSDNWRFQEAAIMSLSSILENPTHAIYDVITQAIPVLLNMIQSHNQIAVRDSAAWTLGRICKFHPQPTYPLADNILQCAGTLLVNNGSPRLVSHCCWMIFSFCQNFPPSNNPVLPYYTQFLETLYKTGKRPDADEHSLSIYAFDALSELIFLAQTEQQFMLIEQLLRSIGTDLSSIASPNPNRDATQLQEHLCSVLQSIVNRTQKMFVSYFDDLMTIFLTLLNTNGENIAEEVFLSTLAILHATEAGFLKYLPSVMPFILEGISNHSNHNINIVCVGLVSDIVRFLPDETLGYCDTIILALINNIENSEVDRMVKPVSLACIGDIAMCIEGNFTRYIESVFSLLEAVSHSLLEAEVPEETNSDYIEYVNLLHSGLLDCFIGVFQGERNDELVKLVFNYCDLILNVVVTIVLSNVSNDDLNAKCAGLIGDTAEILEEKISQKFTPQILEILNKISQSPIEKTREEALWAKEVLGTFGME